MRLRLKLFNLSLFLFFILYTQAKDGYQLWLSFDKIENDDIRKNYISQINSILIHSESPTSEIASRELSLGLSKLLDEEVSIVTKSEKKSIILSSDLESELIIENIPNKYLNAIGEGGYLIFKTNDNLFIIGNEDVGMLYGVFHLLKHMKLNLPIKEVRINENPKLEHRLLNHWDNLDGTVERGYSGSSIWNWHQLPEYIDQRYIDYARANASVGINGAVLTNVNANSLVFRSDYILKAAALADLFRPYGIKVYLTARFSSPIELGGLRTADPKDPQVKEWWRNKVNEIYKHIPDFGGLLVKANSEGQPGPQDYSRSHADGANVIADALLPHNGIVIWRAFVYSSVNATDRAKQAFDEFLPLDSEFRENVMIQVKNGPIDFQPREPIHPLFGAMKKTSLMMEFQITKEYLGQGTHLVGLGKMYEEILSTDTYHNGEGSTVSSLLKGDTRNNKLSGIAGVANIGSARNWTGHLFGQADWFTFGRLAWNPDLNSSEIYKEWSELSFDHPTVRKVAQDLLVESYETCVQYMTPLGLHHIMATDHHYGPGPWVDDLGRPEWNPVYYHQADAEGLGFDRTSTGSNALGQYHSNFQAEYENINDCPMKFLLWFHHVSWDHMLPNGNTLWNQLCEEYYTGAKKVSKMKARWKNLNGMLDSERYDQVLMHLTIQENEARWWRDACIAYFQTFSKRNVPSHLDPPKYELEFYKKQSFPFAPGIKPKW